MARRRRRQRPPFRGRVLVALLAVVVVAAGVTATTIVMHDRRGQSPGISAGHPTPPPGTPPTSAVPSVANSSGPISALWQRPLPSASALFSPSAGLPSGPMPTLNGLTTALAAALKDPVFGTATVSLVVGDPLTGTIVLDDGGSTAVLPASTAKLAVAAAALETLGPRHRLTTRTTLVDGSRVVLVGGGDPTLAGPHAVGSEDPGFPEPARLSDLATRTASALVSRGVTHVQLGYDDSLFSGPNTAVGWKPTYITEGDVAPVSALEVDEGEPDLAKPPRSATPAALAAADFAQLLTSDGIVVEGAATPMSGAGGKELADVESAPVAALVERMLGRSDNDLAEALARQVSLARGGPGTFVGGAQAVRTVITQLGVEPNGFAMVDASGLSRSDRVRPPALVQLVHALLSPTNATLWAAVQGLPVAGFSGTLAGRYATPPASSARGLVRAKTGTLDGVVALAGFVYDASDRVLSFAIVANGIGYNDTVQAEAALDKVVASLAGCGCT